jgi:hypothetical protein
MLPRYLSTDRATWLTASLLLAVTVAAWIGVIQQAAAMDAGNGMADQMAPGVEPGGWRPTSSPAS